MTLADALRSSPAAGAVAEALAGSAAWIVGGAVRDALLGRPVVDLDVAVPSGDEQEAARAVAKRSGGPAFELSAEFGTWRVLDATRAWHVDVTALRAEQIEADLRLRDFTANAIAVPVAESAAPIDPLGGADDIEAKRLRVASQRSFADDPLRILRAARIAAELGFEIDPATVSLAHAEAGRAAEPAGERQLAELRRLVGGPDPVGGLEHLDRLGGTAAVLPELEALRGVTQNPNHHLDVHGHTIEVLENLLEVERDLDAYAGESATAVRDLLSEPLADEMTRGDALRFAAILHDVGKPATRAEHEGGFVSFIGHDRAGAEILRSTCERLRSSRAFSHHLEALTLHHLHLGFMTHERPLSRRRLYDYLKTCEPVAADVTLLTVADRLSARGTGPTATPEMIEAHLELAREVLPEALAWHRDGPPPMPVAGDELAAAVGVEPGPELGRLLGEIEAAVFAGEVSSREDAIEYARRLRSG
jgi:putative nucleotidyltransferase with HDIG domain